MYISEHTHETIKEAQIDMLKIILDEGEEVENLLEINNISTVITDPLLYSGNLLELLTPIGEKHFDQMMLKPNLKLPKTHYNRLHNFSGQINDPDMIKEHDQIEEVIERLKENPYSKRCVLTLWSPEDTTDKYSLSWTMSQLMIRDGKLIMTNFFRGNDIWNAFPFNMFGIAKLQEGISRELKVAPGEFIVHIGSAHIYKVHVKEIQEYLDK